MTPTVRSVRRALRTLGVEAERIRIVAYVAYDGDWRPDHADVERWLDLPIRTIGLMPEVDELAELARQDTLEGRPE